MRDDFWVGVNSRPSPWFLNLTIAYLGHAGAGFDQEIVVNMGLGKLLRGTSNNVVTELGRTNT